MSTPDCLVMVLVLVILWAHLDTARSTAAAQKRIAAALEALVEIQRDTN